ncbi:MAG: tetratricopeptide repeat protein [Devosia sp.]|nr:tetratricopeptide repeat protein [Devosia sp.]
MARKQRGFGAGPQSAARGWQALKGPAAAPPAADPLAQTYSRGLELHRQGKLTDAGLLYQQVLAVNPNHAEASHSLGMVLHQTGKSDVAERLIRRAIKEAPHNPVFHSNLGVVLLGLGRPAEAVDSYRRALKYDPEAPALYANLGAALLAMDRPADAVQAERRALRLKPGYAVAHAQLARALAALGRGEEAVMSFGQAVASQPGYIDAYVWWGDMLAASDQLEAAAAKYREAAALKPDHAGAHLGLAEVLARLGQHGLAADNFRAAAYVRPSARAYAGLARELVALERPDEAIDACRTGLRLADEPGLRQEIEALLVSLGGAVDAAESGKTLSDLERDEAQYRIAVGATPGNPVALANLASALSTLGRLEEAVGYYRQAIEARPDYFFAWSEYLFTINYLGDLGVAEMAAEARRYGELVETRIPPRPHHPNDTNPERRLKVGLVSGDLHAHPVGRFLEAVVAAIDPATIELVVYHNAALTDQLTESLKASMPNWHQIERLSDAELADRIFADGIDILLDLSGHTAHNRLLVFAAKPAPVAASWIGYFATTGLRAIDYVLATRWVIPDDETGQWVERPWHLPETYLCFSPPRLHVPLAPPPAFANGYVTFGSANNINKLNDRTAACWAEVLKAVPASKLLLRSRPLKDAAVAEQVRARFEALGIAPDRLLLSAAENDYGRHLGRYNDVDIALDPFPYAGGTTTVEALWMGVPVLTLRGDRYVAHMGENILHNLEMPDWIAADIADYVAKAQAFAAAPEALAAQRQNLRHRLMVSPLCDAPRFARNFETACRGMWRKWCAAQPAI